MKFAGLRKPPALRLMLMILLFKPSATPLVIGCFDEPQDTVEMTLERGGHLLHRLEPRADRPARTSG